MAQNPVWAHIAVGSITMTVELSMRNSLRNSLQRSAFSFQRPAARLAFADRWSL